MEDQSERWTEEVKSGVLGRGRSRTELEVGMEEPLRCEGSKEGVGVVAAEVVGVRCEEEKDEEEEEGRKEEVVMKVEEPNSGVLGRGRLRTEMGSEGVGVVECWEREEVDLA